MAAISGSSTRDNMSGMSRAKKEEDKKRNLSREKKKKLVASVLCLYPLTLPFYLKEVVIISSSSHFGSSGCPEELLSPFTAHRLEATDYVSADSAGFAIPESAVPVASFDPPGPLFDAFFLTAEVSYEFASRPESSRCRRRKLARLIQRIAQAPERQGDVGCLRHKGLQGDERVQGR